MNFYNLNIPSNNIGGYFSSEQLDLLSIINCQTYKEIVDFVYECKQLDKVLTYNELKSFTKQDIEQLKHFVFISYQNTLVPHNSKKETVLNNALSRLELTKEDIDFIKQAYLKEKKEEIIKYIKQKYPNKYEKLLEQNHHFISTERDQNKNNDLYNELTLINNNLIMFNTLLIGSIKPETVINDFLNNDNKNRFDFYFVKRDLAFAKKT